MHETGKNPSYGDPPPLTKNPCYEELPHLYESIDPDCMLRLYKHSVEGLKILIVQHHAVLCACVYVYVHAGYRWPKRLKTYIEEPG